LPEGQVLRPADLHQSTAHGGIGDREFDMLARLVDKSLVVTSVPGEGGATRYRLLETLRAYGGERLVAR
jgi:predicted ATPase